MKYATILREKKTHFPGESSATLQKEKFVPFCEIDRISISQFVNYSSRKCSIVTNAQYLASFIKNASDFAKHISRNVNYTN